ncbi:MAG: class I tRNA ligase family protein [Chloroflexi bacterium]|nr:class I tRNA ligase family protein [Chloroflexota bacterium]
MDGLNQADKPESPTYTAADTWILYRLDEVVSTVNRLMDSYQYGEAGRQAYEFLWGEFARLVCGNLESAIAGELARPRGQPSRCYSMYSTQSLRLLHPSSLM